MEHTTDAIGTQFWKLDGKFHRLDGPAIDGADGDQYWFINNKLHREDGPAISVNGDQDWFINGKRHRVDGPAIICLNGRQVWYINDELCRAPHNGNPMPVILEKHKASFNGFTFFPITAEEYDNYKYKHQPTGRHTKAALREN